jgi:hypothetical protein
MDPPPVALVQSYQVGIVLGILILSTLILFPGRQEIVAKKKEEEDLISKRPAHKINSDNDCIAQQQQQHYWTPHRRLNTLVYLVLFGVLCFVLFYSYRDPTLPTAQQQRQHPTTLMKLLFRTYFPKEAAVLWKKSRWRKSSE